jgi:hypothetical protein
MASHSGGTMKFAMSLIVIATLVDMLIKMYRRVRPTPNQQTQMQQFVFKKQSDGGGSRQAVSLYSHSLVGTPFFNSKKP